MKTSAGEVSEISRPFVSSTTEREPPEDMERVLSDPVNTEAGPDRKVFSSLAVKVTLATAAFPVKEIFKTEQRFLKSITPEASPKAIIGNAPGPNESLTYFWVCGSVSDMIPSEKEPAISYGYTAR